MGIDGRAGTEGRIRHSSDRTIYPASSAPTSGEAWDFKNRPEIHSTAKRKCATAAGGETVRTDTAEAMRSLVIQVMAENFFFELVQIDAAVDG